MFLFHLQIKVIFIIKHNCSFFNSLYYIFFIFSIFCNYTA